MEMNYYWEANDNFKILMNEIDKFKIPVQKRLRQIKKDWANLVAFYFVDGAPATNNPLENYYSASLKAILPRSKLEMFLIRIISSAWHLVHRKESIKSYKMPII